MPIIGSQGAWQGQERLDERARRAVQRAEATGAAYGLRQVPPDVLLLALLEEPDGAPAQALSALGLDPDAARTTIAGAIRRRGAPVAERSLLDAAAREAVILGANEARRGGFNQAGAGHLLLGVLEAREGAGVRALLRQGAAIPALRPLVNSLEEGGGGAALFAAAFKPFLARIGGARICPRCEFLVHGSFHHCYNCGAVLRPSV